MMQQKLLRSASAQPVYRALEEAILAPTPVPRQSTSW